MNQTTLLILCFFPILLIPILIYAGRIHKFIALLLGCFAAGIIAMFFWKVSIYQVAGAFVQGLWKSGMVLLAMWSVALFLSVLQRIGALSSMYQGFAKITSDRRIQMIIVAWFIGSGLENILGFGITCGICAFILMRMGFPPACAVMVSIMGPVSAHAFSMVGMPMFYGIAEGLNPTSVVAQLLHKEAYMEEYLKWIIAQTSILSSIAGTFMPLFMIMMTTRFFGRKKEWTSGLSIAPFAIFCGLAFTIPFSLAAIYLKPDFAPIIGSTVGLMIAMLAIRFDFLISHRDIWDFQDSKKWEVDWSAEKVHADPPSMPTWMAWSPVFILMAVVLSSHLPLIADFLKSYSFTWNHILGSNVDIVAHPFYQPCSEAVLLAVIFLILLYRISPWKIVESFIATGPFVWGACKHWLLIVPMLNIYIYSATNSSGLPSMLQVMVRELSHIPGASFFGVFLSPLAGAIGSALGQSNTISNMLLAEAQFNFAQNLALPTSLFLSLQMAGASAGNMIAFSYLAATGGLVGMLGYETPMSRKIVFPVIWYTSILGILGLGMLYFWKMSKLPLS